MYVYVIDEIIAFIESENNPPEGAISLPWQDGWSYDDAIYGVNNTHVHNPQKYLPDDMQREVIYTWNTLTKKFDADQVLFRPIFDEYLSRLRDAAIINPAGITVTGVSTFAEIYTSSNEPTGNYELYENDYAVTFTTNERTKNAFIAIDAEIQIDNIDAVIEFKFNNGYANVKGDTIQRCLSALRKNEQQYFSAERKVVEKHTITPYELLTDIENDFNEFAGL